jgi:hypothetical protein
MPLDHALKAGASLLVWLGALAALLWLVWP